MSSSSLLISGMDAATAVFALSVFLGGAAAAVFSVLVIYLIRRAGLAGVAGIVAGAGLVMVGGMVAAVLFDRQLLREQAAERRALEASSADLVARAIAPGSALACLEMSANPVIQTACEKAVFASPEAIAAAATYVDAKLSLLARSTALAERDKTYRPTADRLRRSLEEDRFGLVAYVLATRGCNPANCADFALLRDSERVVANMKTQLFESQVGAHAMAWQSAAPATVAAASPLPSLQPTAVLPPTVIPPMATTPTTAGGPPPGKFDFPSSASIPPVSIMNAEPGAPAAEAKSAAPPVPKRPPARRQAAKPPAAPKPPPSAAPREQPAPAEPPQTSGSR